MALLTGCAAQDPQVIRVPYETIVIERESVPTELLEPCEGPDLASVRTTGDLERAAIAAIAAAECGNADKAAIREWQLK